jgi:hypothetical protein
VTRGAAAAAKAAACAEACRAYPTLAGIEPTVERRGSNAIYTFRKPPVDGPPSPAPIVRVTVDAEGRVLRVVASR